VARSSSILIPRPHRAAMPRLIEPMLAQLSDLPAHPEQYSYEFKWDGVRVLAYFDGRKLTLRSRNQIDITRRYPELHALADALRGRRAVLDGEIVALDQMDRPSFPLLQHRMHVNGPSAGLVEQIPANYFLFDLLYLDGRSLMNRPLVERRDQLEELTLSGPSGQVPPSRIGQGQTMLQAARRHRLEGLVAKKLQSIYLPGVRNGDWLKIKIVQSQELVIGGLLPLKNGQSGIGALLLGYFDAPYDGQNKKFHYAGKVGAGFRQADHKALLAQLNPLRTNENPFAERLPGRDHQFVKPALIAEVEYRRWPAGGLIQQASYKRLRSDKDPHQVVKEDRACTPTQTSKR